MPETVVLINAGRGEQIGAATALNVAPARVIAAGFIAPLPMDLLPASDVAINGDSGRGLDVAGVLTGVRRQAMTAPQPFCFLKRRAIALCLTY
ncbi:hypothetical protein CEP88_07395 [Roseobacter denitrificans]|uniref:Sugar ABC transporter, ATP-binding protein, putative n=1 Tax=Roseobacter denitrificans (strain ATCC 33942 / OCh 114) TaxID=375451 RepID=Q162N8_ROSDO|nr:hypothetical protein [Roseobacter denitrificans]ABG33055.1 sugar ABC transporter, ATP-binding protein, putative [Roseobacter denitrificans OCh 114]AVL52430.1 hypothetical protein CEP88_07395 [Roseobacter denitrificans]SFG08758.1 sn-glycerol 3-phosphate transport system ATP-binding protein [Roseobacter denitrificans OCh 114]